MHLSEFRDYCHAKPGVTEDHPGKGEVAWMKVAGKMFAMTNIEDLTMDGERVRGTAVDYCTGVFK